MTSPLNTFATQTASIPLSQLDANFTYVNGKIVSVKDYGAVGDGVTDDTTAIQAALNYGVSVGAEIFFPAGTYKVTSSLSLKMHTSIRGESDFANPSVYTTAKATVIAFSPSSAQSLFVCDGSKNAVNFRDFYAVSNLTITGNSASASGNSIYAFDVDSVIYSCFKNIGISGFRTGMRVYASINNIFENIYIQGCYIAAVLYDGGTATTDVWSHCTFRTTPIGIQTSGSSLGIRFSNCLFETLDTYGVNLVKECYQWAFDTCYSENVPAVSNANNAMFRVGYDGSATASVTVPITIIGGYYGGRNAGAIGNWIDLDTSYGATISAPFVTRYTYVVRATANTLSGSICVSGGQFVSITSGFYTGPTLRLQGVYPNANLNFGAGYGQTANFKGVNTDVITAEDGNGTVLTLSGSALQIAAAGDIYPSTNGTVQLGIAANRWKLVRSNYYHAAGPILVAPPAGVLAIGNETAATANTGASGAPPAQVAGYFTWMVGTTAYRIPYYNV